MNPKDASDALFHSLDPKGYYTNVEMYANSLVESIMKEGNADALETVDEYYPSTATTGISSISIDKNADKSIASIEYFSLNGSKLHAPSKGISIRKITQGNGQVITDKVIKKL